MKHSPVYILVFLFCFLFSGGTLFAQDASIEDIENTPLDTLDPAMTDPIEADSSQPDFSSENLDLLRIKFDADFGHTVQFSALREEALLNPGNILEQVTESGHFYHTLFLDASFPHGFRFTAETMGEWFNWTGNMDTKNIGSRLYGSRPADLFSIKSWELGFTSPDAFLGLGIGSMVWEPGPAKYLKAANYFGWLFNENEKTLMWLGLNFDPVAVELVFAPRYDWVPESFAFDSPSILPGGSVVYLQTQFFIPSFDAGIYGSWDQDWNAGLWLNYALTPDLYLYGEASLTSKAWVPELNSKDFSINQTITNGLRTMLGLMYSPEFIDLTFYLEGMYTGDAYTAQQWADVFNTLDFADSLSDPRIGTGIRASLAQNLRYSYLDPWSLALYIKPNVPVFDVLDWDYSLRFDLPSNFYSRLTAKVLIPGDLELGITWDSPFTVGAGNKKAWRTLSFMYTHKLSLYVSVKLHTRSY